MLEARIGRRAAAAALVEHQDLIFVGIELAPVVGARAAARTAVKEDYGLAVAIAAKLPVEAVAVSHVETTGLIGLDLGIKGAAFARLDIHQKLISS